MFYTHCSNQIVPNRPKWFQKRFLGRKIEKKLYISVNKLKKCNFFWKRLKKNKKTHFFRLKNRKNEFKWLQIDITKWFQKSFLKILKKTLCGLWVYFEPFGVIFVYLKPFGDILRNMEIYLKSFGAIWHIWSHFRLFGVTCDYLEPFGTIWVYLETFV